LPATHVASATRPAPRAPQRSNGAPARDHDRDLGEEHDRGEQPTAPSPTA
jgi:hypothetical protein